jgi:hypothetical protein
LSPKRKEKNSSNYCVHWVVVYPRGKNYIRPPRTRDVEFISLENKGGCHTLASPFTLKKYLKAKEELWKLKNISPLQKI